MDIIGDFSTVWIVLIPFISLLVMLFLGLQSPAFDILYLAIWYLCFAALILQDMTTVEITHDIIRIHRRFFNQITIKKEDINRAEVKNNISRKYHFLFYILMLAGLAYTSFHSYYFIHRAFSDGRPIEAMIFSVLSNSLIMIFILILFFNAEKRLRCPSFLEIVTKRGKFRFYSHNPEDFRMIADTEIQEKPS
ncbi:MAG: hypothetical protein SCH66_11700 [Methanolobus sp.]|nr:hypothetical protein [Methanolobus sp.]